jgi:phosphoglycerate dehydrogenase-like enzyme
MPEIRSVLVTIRFRREQRRRLDDLLAPAAVIHAHPRNAPAIGAALAHAEVALLAGDLDERFLAAPRLRWVHCDHAGIERSARPEVFARDLAVTSAAGRSAPALAEHAFFLILSLAYRSTDVLAAQRARRWGFPGQPRLRALAGRTLGIVGLGYTGVEVAARATAFGMRVLAYRRRAGSPPPGVERVLAADRGESLMTLLGESDVVVLACSLSDTTYRMIGARELAAMRSTALLINVARGALIDEDALCGALATRRIAGAGLDVFAAEPLPRSSPLWRLPNVIVTPHATPALLDRDERSLAIVAENVRRWRAGEPLRNRLQPEDVYTRGHDVPALPAWRRAVRALRRRLRV